jgi:nitrate reductase molybdenum cofactor assembly chaperone NarJ/NarW
MSIQGSYLGLALLLSYPVERDGMLDAFERITSYFREAGLAAPAVPFGVLLQSSTLSGLQEDYVAGFDFNPKGSLYLGHHLHGDHQKKAAFMIGIKQEFGRHGFTPVGNELPDHLAVLLGFLAHLVQSGEDSYRRQFIAATVLPGLGRLAALEPASGQRSWQSLIDAAVRLCGADCSEEVSTW